MCNIIIISIAIQQHANSLNPLKVRWVHHSIISFYILLPITFSYRKLNYLIPMTAPLADVLNKIKFLLEKYELSLQPVSRSDAESLA